MAAPNGDIGDLAGEWTESKDVGNLLMICRTASGTELSGPRVGDTEGRDC